MKPLVTLFAAAAVVFVCASTDEAHAAGTAELKTLTVPATVPPGGSLPVSAEVLVSGVTATSVTLVFTGDTSWTNATLTYNSTVSTGPEGTLARYAGSLGASKQIGIHALTWQASTGGVLLSSPTPIAARTEVTCSNGAFCDGIEKYVNGRCVNGPPPCDDGDACTTDDCNPTTDMCSHATAASCAVCAAKNCTPKCNNKVCGSDGCGGSCGTCPVGQACVGDGAACSVVNVSGTCANPIPLSPTTFSETLMVSGDTTNGFDETAPPCAPGIGAREVVYSFSVPGNLTVGIEARVTGFDTVLNLRSNGCYSNSIACSDDATPPGGLGSRIKALLQPGTYYLIVDGATATSFGPFNLSVKFVIDCVPQCDDKFCGDDGCGGDCGACAAGSSCTPFGRCAPNFCVPSCNGRKCGSDGCDGTCGSCTAGEVCYDGGCVKVPSCDSVLPTCKSPACGKQKYCGTDCACYAPAAPAPDLVVDAARLESEWFIDDSVNVPPTSCELVRNCVNAPGVRRLLRFSTEVVNQGLADLQLPPPSQRPDLYAFSSCSTTPALPTFVRAELRDSDGDLVQTGRSWPECVADTARVMEGPSTECAAKFDCSSQGLQAGWQWLLFYSDDAACPFLDITDVPPGTYDLSVTVNPTRVFNESTFENNTTSVQVTIP